MTKETNHNFFSGKVYIRRGEETAEAVQVDIPCLPEELKFTEGTTPCRANVSVSLGAKSTDYGDLSYFVTVGGEVGCTEEAFWSKEAHQKVGDHLLDVLGPLVDTVEKSWIPKYSRPKRPEVTNDPKPSSDKKH